MTEIYLRKEEGSYYLYLLGKNGEPKKNVNLTIKLIHLKMRQNAMRSDGVTVNITTDKNGKVKLGHLRKVVGFEVNVQLFNLNRNFMLNHLSEKQYLTYPIALDINEQDNLELPVLFSQKKRSKISLIRHSNNLIIEDLFEDKIEIQPPEEGVDYGKLIIKGLSDGTYVLHLKDIDQRITLTVHKGSNWQGDQFILKKTCLFENRARNKILKIQRVSIEEAKENNVSEVVIQLEDFT